MTAADETMQALRDEVSELNLRVKRLDEENLDLRDICDENGFQYEEQLAARSREIRIKYDSQTQKENRAQTQKVEEIRRLGFVPSDAVLRDGNARADKDQAVPSFILEPRFGSHEGFASLAPG